MLHTFWKAVRINPLIVSNLLAIILIILLIFLFLIFLKFRLLHQWICAPLTNINSILARQAAISELLQQSHLMEEARGLLAQLPDLERLLSKYVKDLC